LRIQISGTPAKPFGLRKEWAIYRRRAAEETLRRNAEARSKQQAQAPRWGTPEAKASAREELRRRIEAQRNADKIGNA